MSDTGDDTSSTSTQEPGDDRRGKGDKNEGLSEPLADEHVRTQEQKNQAWTASDEHDPRRQETSDPLRVDPKPAETLDMPQELEDKLDDIEAHPSSDAQETSDAEQASGGEAGD
ncbi:MAG: hypothetical protein ACR2G7_10265 [Acidimicrobiales bacterium]